MPLPNCALAHARDEVPPKLQPVATTPAVFVIADLHLGDDALCGHRRRPFANAREMGTEIVRRWNDTVQEEDTVYVLGDVGKRSSLRTVRRLRGRKHLIAGNADDIAGVAASDVFLSIAVAKWIPGALLTHIPVHPSQLRGRTINIHGHLHARTVGDPRYRCVSVEQTEFTPVRLK